MFSKYHAIHWEALMCLVYYRTKKFISGYFWVILYNYIVYAQVKGKRYALKFYPAKPTNVVDRWRKKSLQSKSKWFLVPCWQRCLSLSTEALGLCKQRSLHLPQYSQMESTVNTFSHSCFLIDQPVFSKCVPAHYYLPTVYNYCYIEIPKRLTNDQREGSMGQSGSICSQLTSRKVQTIRASH